MLRTRYVFATILLGTAAVAASAGWALATLPPTGPVSQREPPPAVTNCNARQIEHNKHLAGLFRLDKDPDEAYRSMTPGYIQHNPVAYRMGQVNAVAGRDEFKLLIDMKNRGFGGPRPALPGQPPEDTYHFVMATCNYVMLLKKSFPVDPQNSGKFYEVFDFDLWRIEDGKLAEHWDGGRIPERVPEMIQKPFSEMTPPARPPVPDGTPKR